MRRKAVSAALAAPHADPGFGLGDYFNPAAEICPLIERSLSWRAVAKTRRRRRNSHASSGGRPGEPGEQALGPQREAGPKPRHRKPLWV